MKVKEIDRTANIAWSPQAHHPIYLAAGTAAQQLDSTFSTTASLEVYDLNLSDPGLDMVLKGSIVSEYRFHKIVWGCVGIKASEHTQSSGIIVGGADGGNLLMYDAAKIISDEKDSVLCHKTNHTGLVSSLDFNKFQECLLASGGGESEIFIWDLNNPSSPMTPGAQTKPTQNVSSIAWNNQVQHILASAFRTHCVVWDLRKNEPIIKVSDSSSGMKCKVVAWHPEVATQLCLASDDDHCPVIQLWDLRFATTAVRTLEHHQRGILSMAWCQHDPDLLISCGKDNHIFCWNPNSSVEGGEVICEFPTYNQWSFDVAWCPKNPSVIASSYCDGRVIAYSLLGGQRTSQCSSKVAEAFLGTDRAMQPQLPDITPSHRKSSAFLKKPPKWMRTPCGANFAFDGKLATFVGPSSQPCMSSENSSSVFISQVVTEPLILKEAAELETALRNGTLIEFCHNKSNSCDDNNEKLSWNFLEASLEPTSRAKMLSLLNYDYQHVKTQMCEKVGFGDVCTSLHTPDPAEETPSRMSELSISSDFGPVGDSCVENVPTEIKNDLFHIKTDSSDVSGLINISLITGNIEVAVDLCISNKRWADALILAQAGGHDILQKTHKLYFQSVINNSTKLISAVASSDWAPVIKECHISNWKEVFAAILTYAKPHEFGSLCEILGNRLEEEEDGFYKKNASLCYISSGNPELLAKLLVSTHDLNNIVALSSMVEKIMVLRKAVEQLSGTSPPLHSNMVTKIVEKFATLITSQGNVKGASLYVEDAKEHCLAVLRDQICQSLGLQSPFFPFERIDIPVKNLSVGAFHQDIQNTLPAVSHSNAPVEKSQFYSPYQPLSQQEQSQHHNSTQLLYNPQQLVNQSLNPAVVTPSNYSNQGYFHVTPKQITPPLPTSVAQSVTSVSAPPPPLPVDAQTSYTKNTSGHLWSQRYPKHLHDPSVYSESSFSNQQYYQQTTNSLPQPPVSFHSTMPSSTQTFSANTNMPPYYPSQNSYSQPQASVAPVDYLPPPTLPQQLCSSYTELKSGWNDPPLLKQQPTQGFPLTHTCNTPAAITAPFPSAPEILQPASTGPSIHNYPNSYIQHQEPQMTLMNNPTETPAPMTYKVPEKPKEKGPVPSEHKILQDTFVDLQQRCHQTTPNPQIRRKMDDVAKKLEVMCDKLIEKSLSTSVEGGLHQIVDAIRQNDYGAALNVYSMLVTSANFTEISGFMPSIKILLQTAIQLGVYWQ